MKKLLVFSIVAIFSAMFLSAGENYNLFLCSHRDFGIGMDDVLERDDGNDNIHHLEVGEDFIRYWEWEDQENLYLFHNGELSTVSVHWDCVDYGGSAARSDWAYQNLLYGRISQDYPDVEEVRFGDYVGHAYADRGIITVHHIEKPWRNIYILRSREQVERDAPLEEEILTRHIAYWHQKNFAVTYWDELPWHNGGLLDYSEFLADWNRIHIDPFQVWYEPRPTPAVSGINAEMTDGRVTITWEDPINLENCVYRIFRAEERIDFNRIGEHIGTVSRGSPLEYIDTPPAGTYGYSVMVEVDGTTYVWVNYRRNALDPITVN